MAVSTVTNLTLDSRLLMSEKLNLSYILLWNFSDLFHPELMLESPYDTCTFRFNPTRPHLVAGGTYSGQVVLWDLSETETMLARQKHKALVKQHQTHEGAWDHQSCPNPFN